MHGDGAFPPNFKFLRSMFSTFMILRFSSRYMGRNSTDRQMGGQQAHARSAARDDWIINYRMAI